MRKFIVITCILLSGCVTTEESRITKGFPQDTEQCLIQKEVIWCQKACEIDSTYEWCND